MEKPTFWAHSNGRKLALCRAVHLTIPFRDHELRCLQETGWRWLVVGEAARMGRILIP